MQSRSGNIPTRRDPPEQASGLMFWLLTGLAAAGFVPCVLLPVWRDYQTVTLSERLEAQGVAALRIGVDRQERALEGIRTDPAVVSRLAQRELAFIRPGETQVRINGVIPVRAPSNARMVEPVEPPPPVAQFLGYLPEADYDAVFCREPTRSLVMALCGAVLVAAFVCCPPPKLPDGTQPATPA